MSDFELWSPAQVAAMLGRTEDWLRRVSVNELPKVKVGRSTMYEPADVRAYVRRNKVGERPKVARAS